MCILHFSLIHVYNIYDPLDFWLNTGTTFLLYLLTDYHFYTLSKYSDILESEVTSPLNQQV